MQHHTWRSATAAPPRWVSDVGQLFYSQPWSHQFKCDAGWSTLEWQVLWLSTDKTLKGRFWGGHVVCSKSRPLGSGRLVKAKLGTSM